MYIITPKTSFAQVWT